MLHYKYTTENYSRTLRSGGPDLQGASGLMNKASITLGQRLP